MLYDIVKYGDKILREKAKPVALVTSELKRLATDMLETMHAAQGVGLAAEQIGRSESLCVIDVPASCEQEADRAFNAPVAMPLVLFNPVIVATAGSQRGEEGCLSFPKLGCPITRPAEVTVSFTDGNGAPQTVVVRGFLARAVLHETDHLNGVLFVDHMSAVERLTMAGKLKRLAKANGGTR